MSYLFKVQMFDGNIVDDLIWHCDGHREGQGSRASTPVPGVLVRVLVRVGTLDVELSIPSLLVERNNDTLMDRNWRHNQFFAIANETNFEILFTKYFIKRIKSKNG